jgi:hypothetical protein
VRPQECESEAKREARINRTLLRQPRGVFDRIKGLDDQLVRPDSHSRAWQNGIRTSFNGMRAVENNSPNFLYPATPANHITGWGR